MTRAHTHRAVSPAALTQSGKFSQALPANAHEARSLLTAPIVYSLLLPFAVLRFRVLSPASDQNDRRKQRRHQH